MCRNIKTLHNFEPPATEEEVRGCGAPVRAQGERVAEAVEGQRGGLRSGRRRGREHDSPFLSELVTSSTPRDRDVEAARARARAEKRFGRAA